MITEVVGKEIEKIKGDYESYINGLNMVGEISHSQYSELYDEGTKQIQKAYELGKSELEKENSELKNDFRVCEKNADTYYDQLTKAKEIIEQLLLLPYANNEEVYADVTSYLDEAEQFLKDSEVEK